MKNYAYGVNDNEKIQLTDSIIGLTHEPEATAEPRRFTVSGQANDMGIDGFLSSSFI